MDFDAKFWSKNQHCEALKYLERSIWFSLKSWFFRCGEFFIRQIDQCDTNATFKDGKQTAGCTNFFTETMLRRPVSVRNSEHPAVCLQSLKRETDFRVFYFSKFMKISQSIGTSKTHRIETFQRTDPFWKTFEWSSLFV